MEKLVVGCLSEPVAACLLPHHEDLSLFDGEQFGFFVEC